MKTFRLFSLIAVAALATIGAAFAFSPAAVLPMVFETLASPETAFWISATLVAGVGLAVLAKKTLANGWLRTGPGTVTLASAIDDEMGFGRRPA